MASLLHSSDFLHTFLRDFCTSTRAPSPEFAFHWRGAAMAQDEPAPACLCCFFTLLTMASLVASCRVLLLRRQVYAASIRTRTLSSSSSATDEKDSPLTVIQTAIASLQDASTTLNAIRDTIQAPLTLNSGQEVTFKDIVLHSRDAHPNDFHSRAAKDARATVLPIAESIETDLKQLSLQYTTEIAPRMAQATRICQETPCGGASWEVDFSIPEKVRVEGMDTPCGRLQAASLDFLKLTYTTKQDVILGSRAALIMRLSMELNAPLTLIRQGDDEEQKNKIARVFREQVIPTPWLRSEEEYKQFFEIENEFNTTDKKE